MWHIITEEDLPCTECWHNIRAGSECLSQMPMHMPDKFHRRAYENLCIGCAECERVGKEPCYVRSLNHWYTHTAETKETVGCAYCGEPIPRGTWTVAQKLYAWPEPELESKNTHLDAGGADVGARAAGAASAGAEATKRAYAGAWHNLSPKTQRLLQNSGLGRGLGPRSLEEAQQFYEISIPESIRYQGEEAVRNFTRGKHASHIKPVSAAPNLAKDPSNVVWEKAKRNLSRGSRNMTAAEQKDIKSVNRRSGFSATAKGAAKGGLLAAVMEAPVAGVENFLHWKRGRKSRDKAAMDTARTTASAGAVGVAATTGAMGVAKATALLGMSPTLGPFGAPLAVAGLGLMVGTTVHRVFKAAKHDLPLDEYHLFFCKDTDCKTRLARDVTNAALGRDQRHSHYWLIALALAGLAIAVIGTGVWLM